MKAVEPPSPSATARPVDGLVDHLFRHCAGQMVSRLPRIFGPGNLDLAEEVVQDALLKALQLWPVRGIPDNPRAWLLRVARNGALDRLRRHASLRRKLEGLPRPSWLDSDDTKKPGDLAEVGDDELAMMLMCCHPAIPREGRVALTLKTLGGFSVAEIARAFLVDSSTIKQRVVRAKRLIREHGSALELPDVSRFAERLDSLLEVLYLLFNEGYGAYEGEDLVRFDLCDESIRLASILTRNPGTDVPRVHALLALMLFQASRLPARVDAEGALMLLAEQDRTLWDRAMIERALRHLDRCAEGERLSVYHIQAGIAACHSLAPDYRSTDWKRVLSLYDSLMALAPSPVVALNRAVALAMLKGPDAGLQAIERIRRHPSLERYYLLPATIAELWLRAGSPEKAVRYYRRALELPCSSPEQRFLLRKLRECEERLALQRSPASSPGQA